MCDPVSATMAVVGAVGAYSQQQAAKKGAEAQDRATQQATASATAQAGAADQANNRANAKTADVGAMSSRNTLDAKGGISGTMLTGPQGVDPKTLLLGKSTLLGG
jgi:hypothetical protein